MNGISGVALKPLLMSVAVCLVATFRGPCLAPAQELSE